MAATVRLLWAINNGVLLSRIHITVPVFSCNASTAARASSASPRNTVSLQGPTQRMLLLPAKSLSKSYVPARCTNFFNKSSAEALWKSVTSVSKQGAMKGRGRGANKILSKNLNRGQVIGVGAVNMVWPGLNAPVLRGQEHVSRHLLEPDLDRQKRLIELRDRMGKQKHKVLHPLERGWSGTKLAGRSIGPPDAIGEDTFDGFESIVLEFKMVSVMTGNLGRRRRASVFTVTGNGDGVAGFGLAKALKPQAAIRVSKNKAGQQLMYIERFNEHTVMHDFYTQFGITKIFVRKMPEGTGLICHRAIAAICKMVGIKDLYAKVEGSINIQNMTKAFFLGLIRQNSFQNLADDKQLHLVELREENYNYPKVVASPTHVRTLGELSPNENLDFNIHIMKDRVQLIKKKYPPFYVGTPGWEIHLNMYKQYRNHEKVRLELIKEYGFIRSFLFDKYPECHGIHNKEISEEDD